MREQDLRMLHFLMSRSLDWTLKKRSSCDWKTLARRELFLALVERGEADGDSVAGIKVWGNNSVPEANTFSDSSVP